jgi:hypothetical protein
MLVRGLLAGPIRPQKPVEASHPKLMPGLSLNTHPMGSASIILGKVELGPFFYFLFYL